MTDESLFAAALDRPTPEERAAFLAAACDDPEQRARVQRLLTIVSRAGTFVSRRPVSDTTRSHNPPADSAPPPPVESRPVRRSAVRPPVRVVKIATAVLLVLLLLALLVWGVFAVTQPAIPPPSMTEPTQPEPTRYAIPADTQADGGEQFTLSGGQQLPVWVKMTVKGETVRFRLILAGEPAGTRPFYISERKVSNNAFATPTGPGGPTAPAVGCTAAEAMASIRASFGTAGGRLPTPAEWDHATGLYDHPPGQTTVTDPAGSAVVQRKEPAPPVPGPSGDVNCYGLFDMAGNGREWTCGVITKLDTPPEVTPCPAGPFKPDDLLVLRGRNYTLKEGLTFAQLQQEASGILLQRQLAGTASPYTGFRVVLPISER